MGRKSKLRALLFLLATTFLATMKEPDVSMQISS
uniref:Secreted protein n=1 Tax=Steinernema glaseri TaxID=37863 RepID=A0A1I8A9W4_9BILA